jgi:riboflavin transporter FmnP
MKKPAKPSATPRWSTRRLATMALMLAIGIILSFIEFPLLPGAEFLKFDASFVPSVMVGFSYGPGSGCIVGVLVAASHALFSGNVWGGVMNAVIVLAYVLPATAAYRVSRSNVGIIVGLAVASVAQILVALLMNLLITPIYTGMPVEAVMGLLLFPILPFNILKALINSVLAFILQRSLSGFLHP